MPSDVSSPAASAARYQPALQSEEKKESEAPNVVFRDVTSTEPPPGPTFHPDFIFCGECTDCKHPSSRTNGDESAGNPSFRDESSTWDKSSGQLRTRLLLNHHWKSPEHELMIKSLLQPLAGVASVLVELNDTTVGSGDGARSTVTVHHDASTQDQDLLRSLQQGGYPASIVERRYRETPMGDELIGLDGENVVVVRSTFFVQGICCSSEVPSIRKIVKPMPGVSTLQINITTRRVYVQHDCKAVSAQDIADRLTHSGFRAQILENGGNQVARASNIKTTSVGRSTLQTKHVLHSQDIPKIQHALTTVAGVKRVGINVSDSVLYAEHDVNLVSAVQIQQALQEDRIAQKYEFLLVQDAEVVLAQRTQDLLRQPRSLFVESCLHITNLTLNHVPLLHKICQQHYVRSQVRAVHPHTPSHTVKIEHNPDKVSLEQICTTCRKVGLDAQIVTDGGIERNFLPLRPDDTPQEAEAHKAIEDWQTKNLQFHVVLSGIFWVISLLSVIENGDGFWGYLEYAGLLSVFFGLPPVLLKALRTLRRCEFDANCMMVVAAIGALALGELDEAASVAFLFSVSEFLEARATEKARRALSEIVQLRPDHANLIHPETKEIVIVPAEEVPVGSLISVRTGDKVPADGVVVEGTSSLDESSLTGESVPVSKTVDDTVSGGSINIGSTQLVVRTTSSVDDSTVSRLIRLVEEAQANRSPTEKMVDGFARAYTPVVVLLALIMATIPWINGSDAGREWTMNALIIIVIACPCALTISTPVTYAAGLAATAQRGIVVKGGASLEALGSVDTVVIDKTGTITEGKFSVTHLEQVGETRPRKEMLKLLALMEAPSSHPLSATLVRAAKNEGVSIPRDVSVEEHTILKGEGVTAKVNGRNIYVGNQRLFERIGMYESLEETYKGLAEEWSAEGGSVGFLGVEGEGIIGSFCMTDVVRPEARQAIQSLYRGGIKVMMLTGDGEGAASSVAKQVGIPEEHVHSQLLPEDKLHFVGSLKRPAPKNSFGLFRRKPRVLFIGDGVNDGPAIAVADVGVSMGEGAALAMEMSDVTLMDSNLTKLLYIIKMGSRVMHTIQENILVSLLCKMVVVALTFFGKMTLLYAIASDVGVMLIVTLNGMKLLPGVASLERYREGAVRMTETSEQRPLHGQQGVEIV